MLKLVLKASALLVVVLIVYTCIDPYNPELNGYESLLVVEALVTDEAAPYEVRLSRSIQSKDSIPERIADARVYITDETGKKAYLGNFGGGLYKTNPSEFTGSIGKTYTLHISTSDGKEYISDPAEMLPVPDIDNIYYEKDEEYSGDRSEIQEGIRIYVDTGNGCDECRYIRWEYEETWKFRLADYKRYRYISESLILPVSEVKEFCYKSVKSAAILYGTITPGQTSVIKKVPVCFVASAKTDRLTIQYDILVKQYSLSREAYEFWNNLKQINEMGGTIFDRQPYQVISNIRNVNNPAEKVLGYFQVSASKQKRRSIARSELDELDLPGYQYDCRRIVTSPDDYPPPFGLPPMTWTELYVMFMSTGEYTFVEPVYDETTNALVKLVFTQNNCSDCELTGFSEKPEWWIDLN